MMAIPVENNSYKQRETVKFKRRGEKMTTVKRGEGCFQELDSILPQLETPVKLVKSLK